MAWTCPSCPPCMPSSTPNTSPDRDENPTACWRVLSIRVELDIFHALSPSLHTHKPTASPSHGYAARPSHEHLETVDVKGAGPSWMPAAIPMAASSSSRPLTRRKRRPSPGAILTPWRAVADPAQVRPWKWLIKVPEDEVMALPRCSSQSPSVLPSHTPMKKASGARNGAGLARPGPQQHAGDETW